jgi:hypothetical protein
MEAVIHVAAKISRAMKPGASTDENGATEPFRTVIAGGRTLIRSKIVVTIRTLRGYANGDRDLRPLLPERRL